MHYWLWNFQSVKETFQSIDSGKATFTEVPMSQLWVIVPFLALLLTLVKLKPGVRKLF